MLAQCERLDKAVLLGSRAMGSFTPASDVNIALYGDQLTLTDIASLAEKIDELTMPQRVDLLLHRTIRNKNLLKHI
ncbi:MAG: nucleotidyltransferase domain-containing protein [Phycisphaerae bacterium]